MEEGQQLNHCLLQGYQSWSCSNFASKIQVFPVSVQRHQAELQRKYQCLMLNCKSSLGSSLLGLNFRAFGSKMIQNNNNWLKRAIFQPRRIKQVGHTGYKHKTSIWDLKMQQSTVQVKKLQNSGKKWSKTVLCGS